MGLFRTALIGAAIYGAIKYITKKDETGRSMVDDLKDKAPEWMDKAKNFKKDMEMKYNEFTDEYTEVRP